MTPRRKARPGLTLLELLVVVAILAILAGLVVSNLGDTEDRTRAATAAANLSDASKRISEHQALYHAFPNRFDALIPGTVASGVTPGTTYYALLNPGFTSATAPLLDTPTAPTSTQLQLLNTAGITHVQYHDAAYTGAPSESGLLRAILTTSTPLAKLLVVAASGPGSETGGGTGGGSGGGGGGTFAAGSRAYQLLSSSGTVAYTSGTSGFNLKPAMIAQYDFFVMGLGVKCEMIGRNMQAAPLVEMEDAGRYYSRALAIFAVPKDTTTGEKVKFVGVIGPDGFPAEYYLARYLKTPTN